MLYFDIRGNLLPEPTIQPLTMLNFQTYFVDEFEDNNTRLALFQALQNYIS